MPQSPYMGDIYAFSFNFAPRGWAMCNGQTLPINQNQALFSIIGTVYGGDGVTTFKLPNLQGRVPVGMGSFAGANFVIGDFAGEASHTLAINEMPSHTHTLRADSSTAASNNSGIPVAGNALGQSVASSGSSANLYSTAAATTALASPAVGNQGSGQPHENQQPYLALNYCIALQGLFPSRN